MRNLLHSFAIAALLLVGSLGAGAHASDTIHPPLDVLYPSERARCG